MPGLKEIANKNLSPEELEQLSETAIMEIIEQINSSTKSLQDENDLLAYFINKKSIPIDNQHAVSNPNLSESHKLNILQKTFIVNDRIEGLREEQSSLKKSAETSMINTKVKLYAAETQLHIIREDMKRFNDTIKIGARHPVTKRIMAEKVEKFFKDSINKSIACSAKQAVQISEIRKQRKKIVKENNSNTEASKVFRPDDIVRTQQQDVATCALLSRYESEYNEYKARLNRLQRVIELSKASVRKELGEMDILKQHMSVEENMVTLYKNCSRLIDKEKRHLLILKAKIVTSKVNQIPSVMEYVDLEQKIEKKKRIISSLKGRVTSQEYLHKYFVSQED